MSGTDDRSNSIATGESVFQPRPTEDKWRHTRPPEPPPTVLEQPLGSSPEVRRPKLLWHYTSFDALESITRTGVLWASRIQFLNDEQELRHAAHLVTEAVVVKLYGSSEGRLYGSEGYVLEDQDTIRSVLEQAAMVAKCVVCFSESRDQLSQWRGYGSGSAPTIAIGFDAQQLAARADSLEHGWKLENCLYLAVEKHDALTSIVDIVVRQWPGPDSFGNDRHEKSLKAALAVWDEYLHLAPRLKHEGFREEAEVRLISMPFTDPRVWRFRRGINLIVPYVEFPLSAAGGPISAIREILIGPNPHIDTLASAVDHLCRVRGLSAIVRTSSVPYR